MLRQNSYLFWSWIYKKHSDSFFIAVLGVYFLDTYYLVNNHRYCILPKNNTEDLNYPIGFIEKDFQCILSDAVNDKREIKNKIILFLIKNINLVNAGTSFNKVLFTKVLENSLIYGDYEQYGIEFEKALAVAVKKGLINKESLFNLSITRGVAMRERELEKESTSGGSCFVYGKKKRLFIYLISKFI